MKTANPTSRLRILQVNYLADARACASGLVSTVPRLLHFLSEPTAEDRRAFGSSQHFCGSERASVKARSVAISRLVSSMRLEAMQTSAYWLP